MIDARITPHPSTSSRRLELDPKLHSEEAIKDFKEKYEAEELVPFRLFLEEEGLQSRAINNFSRRKSNFKFVEFIL